MLKRVRVRSRGQRSVVCGGERVQVGKEREGKRAKC